MSLIKKLQRPVFVWCRYCAVAAPQRSEVPSAPTFEGSQPNMAAAESLNSNLTGTPLATPQLDNASTKIYSQKIQNLAGNIANLTLLEVADLNELLKVKL